MCKELYNDIIFARRKLLPGNGDTAPPIPGPWLRQCYKIHSRFWRAVGIIDILLHYIILYYMSMVGNSEFSLLR